VTRYQSDGETKLLSECDITDSEPRIVYFCEDGQKSFF